MFEEINEYEVFSMESEQAVIGAILLKNEIIVDAIDIVQPDSFHLVAHQEIFSAMCYLHEVGQPCDAITLSEALKASSKLETIGGIGYLAQLAHDTPSSANMKAYAKVVLTKANERKVLDLSRSMSDEIQCGEGTSEENINNAMGLVCALNFDDKKERSSDQVLKQLIQDVEYRSTLDGGITGLTTGFDDLDKRTSGLANTDLIILAARPAMGKTTMAMNIAYNSLDVGDGATLVFSMEMSADQLMTRMVSNAGNVFLGSLRDGTLKNDNDDWQRFGAGVQMMKGKKLIIDDRPALKPQQLRAKALKEKRKYGKIKLIVVDYLQLMTVNKSGGRTEDVTQISQSLKALAKEMECPVIALSQLNRSVESRQDKRPVMSDLRDSGAIEQDADIIWFLYREEVYDPATYDFKGIAELNTAKFRNGEIGKDFLKTELQYSRFRNLLNWTQPEEIKTENNAAPFKKNQRA